ncbi:crotonase/enoyl-CoA hydratase family protein [Peribacillus muralis]|uniref:crotonase/enoyl-CoA hydratase family protein n=1 Tax=Peribacillus muralis TaxID=264697 RepID=UPI00070F5AB8|nr:crotonase/enoyl-CoA hydratase family protein [Peribacillus muralis]
MVNTVTLERKGHILLIGLNRPEQNNLFNEDLIFDLAAGLGELERDPDLRCGVLFAHGKHFTLGLDLGDIASSVNDKGERQYPEGSIDIMGRNEPYRTKPLICAVHGICLTLGIEMALASDIRLAETNTRFLQMEVKRGIFPFGGATSRFVQTAGWGNAMRYMLTGDEFSSEEAYRIGIIQEIVDIDNLLPRAIELAENIARQSPLGTQATVKMARLSVMEGEKKGLQELWPTVIELFGTEDAKEGVAAFRERRDPNFNGK